MRAKPRCLVGLKALKAPRRKTPMAQKLLGASHTGVWDSRGVNGCGSCLNLTGIA